MPVCRADWHLNNTKRRNSHVTLFYGNRQQPVSGTAHCRRAGDAALRPERLHQGRGYCPGEPGVLSLLCKSRCLPGNGRLHRLRQVCGAVSPEQRPFEKRKAGLGQKLHPLHGVHLLLPQRGHRVRRKEQRQAPVSR